MGSFRIAFQAAAIPKHPPSGIVARRIGPGEEDLQAVARPFSTLGEHIERTQKYPPFGTNLIDEKAESATHVLINRHAFRWPQPLSRNQEQIRINGADAKGVCSGGAESVSEKLLFWKGLLHATIVRDPHQLV